jgi:transposase
MFGGIKMADLDKQSEFIRLKAKGKSNQEISEKIGVSPRTLINWGKDLSYEIENAHALELEALQDEFYMLKERRIKLFGEKLKAISKEIEDRGLEEVPTIKLFDLFFKMYRLLNKEAVEVHYKSEKKIKDAKELDKLTDPLFK